MSSPAFFCLAQITTELTRAYLMDPSPGYSEFTMSNCKPVAIVETVSPDYSGGAANPIPVPVITGGVCEGKIAANKAARKKQLVPPEIPGVCKNG